MYISPRNYLYTVSIKDKINEKKSPFNFIAARDFICNFSWLTTHAHKFKQPNKLLENKLVMSWNST